MIYLNCRSYFLLLSEGPGDLGDGDREGEAMLNTCIVHPRQGLVVDTAVQPSVGAILNV